MPPFSLPQTIFFIANMLHPVNDFAVFFLLDRYVSHARCGRSTVPMLLIWREPDDVTGPDLLNWPAFALSPAATGRDN